MKFHAGKRSFSLGGHKQTFFNFSTKETKSFIRIKLLLCLTDLIVTCALTFLFAKLLWRCLNDKQAAPLQEPSSFGDARTTTLRFQFFSLIETTTKCGELSIFSWNVPLKTHAVKSEHAVENCFNPNEKSCNMPRLPSLMLSTCKCRTPEAIFNQSPEARIQRKFETYLTNWF